MYLPAVFRGDESLGWQLAAEESFGLLLSEGDLSPLPFLVHPTERTLRAHVARPNPIVTRGGRVSVVFTGPHGYVTPRWYGTPAEHVPTWNYVVARMEGTLAMLDREATARIVADLCARFEPEGGYDPSVIDGALHEQLLHAIVGFEIAIDRVEVKVKLSQNRAPDDRRRVREGFASTHPALARWMERVERR